MVPRKLCQEAWQEIASHFPDFKVLSKGQKLKRVTNTFFFKIAQACSSGF